MPTHNKSGYEIRLEVLQMAMGLASERYHNELDQLRYTAERTKAQAFELPQDNRVAQALKLADVRLRSSILTGTAFFRSTGRRERERAFGSSNYIYD